MADGHHAKSKESKCCCGHSGHGPASRTASDGGVTDPVCGMTVDPETAKHRADHGGQRYYFCSAGADQEFSMLMTPLQNSAE